MILSLSPNPDMESPMEVHVIDKDKEFTKKEYIHCEFYTGIWVY
jgi:hypothetical protein